MNTVFTSDEINLMCIYNADGTRGGLIRALKEMRGYLESDERELAEMTDSVIRKLSDMTDDDFNVLDLFPDF